MVWARSKEESDGCDEVTYRSYSGWWLEGVPLRSRSETDLSSSLASLALPAPLPPSTPLHRCLRVLAGSWKNLFHLGGMSRGGGRVVQARKVAPPSVPEKAAFRNSGSSFGSAGYASAGEDPDARDGLDTGDGVYGGRSPGAYSCSTFSFPAPQGYGQTIQGKPAVYYQHQCLQEDQGIDMTQSPGRDSPGSSGSGSRHSTVSLDSGRASCHHHRPSLSSSSVGSGESTALSHRVDRLILQGVPDQDILHTWLMDLHFEEYYPLFVNAGYDMHTIFRMTPEDLTAIGIKKPHHRKKLKAEIAQLNISDGLPDYIPSSLTEWLRLLRLEEYGSALKEQGYVTVDDTIKIQVEDLEDIGIVKLGHQKRFLLAIKRLHDLKAGKTFPPTPFTPTAPMEDVSSGTDCRCTRFPPMLKQLSSHHWEPEPTLYYTTDIVPIQVRGVRGKSLESLEGDLSACCLETSGMSSFTGGWPPRSGRGYYEDGDLGPEPPQQMYPQGGGTLPRQRPPLFKPRSTHRISHIPDGGGGGGGVVGVGTLKRSIPPPPPPARMSTDCSSVTVVADLHLPKPALQYDQSSFKSSSSAESDSIPFANENAGTIKQRAVRNQLDYIPPIRVQSPPSDSSSSTMTSRKASKDSEDVLNDIGNMLANLTDELDAMLEEEKRQGLTQDSIDY